jgi:hypothetical protein
LYTGVFWLGRVTRDWYGGHRRPKFAVLFQEVLDQRCGELLALIRRLRVFSGSRDALQHDGPEFPHLFFHLGEAGVRGGVLFNHRREVRVPP